MQAVNDEYKLIEVKIVRNFFDKKQQIVLEKNSKSSV